MPKEKIVVIGFGWVGQANALALLLDDYEVSYFDLGEPEKHYTEYINEYNQLQRLKSPLEIDGENTVYIICVGDRVDEVGNQDVSNIKKAIESIKNTKGKIILRSTILPSSLKDLKFDIYLPEFLHEKVAVRESINPQYMVVGKKNENVSIPSFIDIWIKRSVKDIVCSPEDASHIKYLSNYWNSIKIAFTNEFGCSIEEPVDQKTTGRIDNIINFIFNNEPYLRYGRSYGGHCLPKDTRAYSKWCEDRGRHTSLLKGTIISNNVHKQREEKHHHLKEWFSNWPEPEGSGWVALHILGKSIKRNILHPFKALERKKTIVYRKKI